MIVYLPMTFDWLKDKNKLLIAIGCIFLVFVVALLYISSESTRQARRTPSDTTEVTEADEFPQDETVDRAVGQKPEVSSPPEVTFNNYQPPAQLPSLPASSQVLRFKQDFTPVDTTALGRKLGFTQELREGNEVLLYNLKNTPYGFLRFNTADGSFMLQAKSRNPALPEGANPPQVALAFLQTMGLTDQAIVCDITYKQTDVTGATFVECHRQWSGVGLPILNLAGLLNEPQGKPLAELAVGMVDETTPDNPRIINTSTGQDGKERPKDFNTATVVVSDEGRVLMADSNLKWVETTQKLNPASDFLTPQDAWQQITEGKGLSFTVPAGEGVVDVKKAFVNGRATAPVFNATDVIIAYLEVPAGSQEVAAPMYVFLGSATLDTGYEVRVIKTIPATKLGLSAATSIGASVAGVSDTQLAQADLDPESLKLRTLTLVPTYPAQIAEMVAGCQPSEFQLSPQYPLPPYGKVGPWSIPPWRYKADGSLQQFTVGTYYLIPGTPSSLPEINAVIEAFTALNVPDPGGQKAQPRQIGNLQNEWNRFNLCPLRLTGGSPSVFVYAPAGTRVIVDPVSKLTYADPKVSSGAWNVNVTETGVLANGVKRDYLYYEYDPTQVDFTRPAQGWNVTRENLSDLADTIGASMGLNRQETDRLSFELSHAADDVDGHSLFVGLIPQSALDAQLPLTAFSTATQSVPLTRVHFYVGKSGGAVQAPQLTPLTRSTHMILELGSFAQK